MAFGDIGDDVVITQTLSGETAYIDISYASTTAKTYYSNNGITDLSGVYDYIIDGILDATVKNDTSGAIITGLIPGSTWVVHVESASDLSGGKKQINIEGPPAKPLKGINYTVTEYTNKIHFDFETDSSIWNHGVPSSAKVIIKSLNNANTFKSVTKVLSNTDRSFDITGLEHNTQYEVKVQLTNTLGAGLMSDSSVFSTDDNRAAVNILSATGLQSLVSSSAESYVDICFNVGPGPNAAATGDIIRYALDNCNNLITTSGEVGTVDSSGNSDVQLVSNLLTGGNHTIKLLIQAAGTADVPLITDGNASTSEDFNIKFKPDAILPIHAPKNATSEAITFTFDTGANNGWLPSNTSYKAVVTASGEDATPSNEINVSPGTVTITKGQLTDLSGVALNRDLNIHIKKTVDGSGVVNDNSATNLVLDAPDPAYDLFYIVDPEFNSCSVTESDDPSQNYLHITYDISGDAVQAESVLNAYIRYDQAWNATNPNTLSGEHTIKLDTQLVGVDVAIDSSANDGSNVYVLLELNNEGKKAYKTAEVTLKDREPEPKLLNLFGWSDYAASASTSGKATFDFEFNQPTYGNLTEQRFEVWLKDLSSSVFKNVASDLKATKLRAGGVTIRASIDKNCIKDASGFSPNDVSYNNQTDLGFGVAQTNPNYTLSSSDFSGGFTNDERSNVVQTVKDVKYHPVNVKITSVRLDLSNTLIVTVVGSSIANKLNVIRVFDSSANKYINLLSATNTETTSFNGKFTNNNETLSVTTAAPISTKSEYRFVLQVKEGTKLLSQDTQVFTYAFAPKITTTVPLIQAPIGTNVDASLNSSTQTDVSGQYAVSITPNGAALTEVKVMYYADHDTTFAKVPVPVKTPSDELNGTYTAYLDFTNREGAILMAANSRGLDAHHFYAPTSN